MISKDITLDKRVNDLSDDTSRLAFTWLITFADREGRTHGDPALLRSLLFPRRIDVSIEQIKSYIKEWQDAGLIVWYESNNDLWIAFPKFDKHQIGMRKDREPESVIPPPPIVFTGEELPDDIRNNAGSNPDNVGLKRREVKRKEDNNGEDDIFTAYEENIGGLTPMIAEQIKDWEDNYNHAWIIEAIEAAVKQEVRKSSYINAILKNWHTNGKGKRGEKLPDPASVPAEVWS